MLRETETMIVLIIMCGAFAAAFLYCGSREKNVSAVVFKGLASACFVAAGLLLSPGTDTARSILAGLITGCMADIVIELKKLCKNKPQVPFLIGCFLFLAGHVMYIAAVFPMSSHKLICIAAAVILAPLLVAWIFRRTTLTLTLKIVGAVYLGIIVLLNCASISNLFEVPSAFTRVFAAGALLFLASDVLLVINTFGDKYSQKIKNIYISLYYAGQILIALSLQYAA